MHKEPTLTLKQNLFPNAKTKKQFVSVSKAQVQAILGTKTPTENSRT